MKLLNIESGCCWLAHGTSSKVQRVEELDRRSGMLSESERDPKANQREKDNKIEHEK
jgi:hypothetical protein